MSVSSVVLDYTLRSGVGADGNPVDYDLDFIELEHRSIIAIYFTSPYSSASAVLVRDMRDGTTQNVETITGEGADQLRLFDIDEFHESMLIGRVALLPATAQGSDIVLKLVTVSGSGTN